MMRFRLLFLLGVAVLVGCSSPEGDATPRPDPNAGLTKRQKIEKIQNDPNIPDGLKKIQTETLSRQPGD
jgi:hypothetical protein